MEFTAPEQACQKILKGIFYTEEREIQGPSRKKKLHWEERRYVKEDQGSVKSDVVNNQMSNTNTRERNKHSVPNKQKEINKTAEMSTNVTKTAHNVSGLSS